ncbi:hypothetical protein [Acidovorax cavernicola]|uniref:Uncharacterized protein n=1 Tax=Acidovorax cavernicola TaxID=1675792 RepID=A0A9X8D738_9BURK|nr:hypothetical protein [Acidovorax cavernicola]RIX83173.1 hypothetical protein D3H34_06965 [Acidovorax cavernicola]
MSIRFQILLSAEGASAEQKEAAKSVFLRAFVDALGRPANFRPYLLAWAVHERGERLSDEQKDLVSAVLLAQTLAQRQGQKELGGVAGVFEIVTSSSQMKARPVARQERAVD